MRACVAFADRDGPERIASCDYGQRALDLAGNFSVMDKVTQRGRYGSLSTKTRELLWTSSDWFLCAFLALAAFSLANGATVFRATTGAACGNHVALLRSLSDRLQAELSSLLDASARLSDPNRRSITACALPELDGWIFITAVSHFYSKYRTKPLMSVKWLRHPTRRQIDGAIDTRPDRCSVTVHLGLPSECRLSRTTAAQPHGHKNSAENLLPFSPTT